MKAAFKHGPRVTLRDIALRPVAPQEIRLRVEACGICGTDLLAGGPEGAGEQPFGHEIAGTVLERGSAVTRVAVGQRVALDSATPCGECDQCRNMRQELCTNIQSFFNIRSFGCAEEMLAPAISAVPIGDDMSPEVACVSEPLGVAIDLVRLAEIRLDSNVLVLGPGPIGLMAAALARRQGARRVFLSAFHREAARVAVARQFGVDDVLDPEVTPLPEADFGCAIDRVLVTTPPPTLADTFQVAGKGGIISFIGIAYGDRAFCTFDANEFHFKKLQLRASFASPALFTPLALQYLREGVIDGEALISHRFPLDRIEEAMATARDTTTAVKVVVVP